MSKPAQSAQGQHGDQGFVLLDALVAAALVGIAVVGSMQVAGATIERAKRDAAEGRLMDITRAVLVSARAGVALDQWPGLQGVAVEIKRQAAGEGERLTLLSVVVRDTSRGGKRQATLSTLIYGADDAIAP